MRLQLALLSPLKLSTYKSFLLLRLLLNLPNYPCSNLLLSIHSNSLLDFRSGLL